MIGYEDVVRLCLTSFLVNGDIKIWIFQTGCDFFTFNTRCIYAIPFDFGYIATSA